VLESAVCFGAGHSSQGGVGMMKTFAIGRALAVLTLRAKSVLLAIVVYALIDGFGLVALKRLSRRWSRR
jgi:membrane protease YdiL (CAAX protease family)